MYGVGRKGSLFGQGTEGFPAQERPEYRFIFRLMREVERIVEQNIYYDFYGELLTKHQRQIYEDAIFNDLSLSEIAEHYGITRQGAHDIIKRCDVALRLYEDKLHLIERFENLKETAKELKDLIASMNVDEREEAARRPDPSKLKLAMELTERIMNGI